MANDEKSWADFGDSPLRKYYPEWEFRRILGRVAKYIYDRTQQPTNPLPLIPDPALKETFEKKSNPELTEPDEPLIIQV